VSLFDLVFIVLFLMAVGALMAAAWFALGLQFGRVRRILFRLLLGATVYMAAVIAVSLILPRRVVKIGDVQCFYDWCVLIVGFRRTLEGARVSYNVDLRFVQSRSPHLAAGKQPGRLT